MILEQPATESDMVALFLRSELGSVRWGDTIRDTLAELSLPLDLVADADTDDPAANQRRAAVLGAFRGYRQDRSLFEDYPADVQWRWVLLEHDDLDRLKYIDYSYWNELTRGSRRPRDAVSTIVSGEMIYGVSNRPAIDGAAAVRSGTVFEPVILVATDPASELVILEGHSRVTAYALAGQERPRQIRALLGISSGFAAWL
jgi:hypothetical protein